MGSLHDKTFPGESAAYRAARDTLLATEAALHQQIEAVAALRRALPSDGAARHLEQHVNLAVVARAPVDAPGAVVRQRGWRHLRLLSAARNTYQPDYLAEDDAGNPWPNCCGRPAAGPNVADAASQAPNSRRGRRSHKLCNAHGPRRGLAATAAVSLTGRRVP
jgi:hypothetical protein